MGVLDGQIVLITGCARYRGIGRAMSHALAGAGADLAVTDVEASGTRNLGEQGEDEERIGWTGLGSLADEIAGVGRQTLTLLGDVSRREDAERMVQQTLDQYGRIDVLINNAGAPQGADRNYLWDVPEEAFDLVMDVNVKGNYLMSVAVARHMLARGGPGRIINIALGRRQGRLPPDGALLRLEVRGGRPDPVAGPGARAARHHGQRDLPHGGRHGA